MKSKKLFEPTQLAKYSLKNHIVMSPMTRSRAIGNVPNDLMAQYYGERAEAGLIITEGTSPSPNGLGYPRIPGLFNQEQVQGWKKVTDAVHAKKGLIFIQLMHTGRVGQQLNLPQGAKVLAPSALALGGTMWTDTQGAQPHTLAKEMTLAEIKQTHDEYVKSAELAIQAGFDGVEFHAANGYLLEQFLNPKTNQRQDAYGSTEDGRMKFLLDIVTEAAQKIGAGRIGIRISPYGNFNETGEFPGVNGFYTKLAQKLSALGIAYLHLLDHSSIGAPAVPAEIKRLVRESFKGTLILAGGYDADRAENDLQEKRGDLFGFGRPFLANPDLVEKLKKSTPLKEADPKTFYTPGPEGYTIL
jgi:N-ethylmaleimide reductase